MDITGLQIEVHTTGLEELTRELEANKIAKGKARQHEIPRNLLQATEKVATLIRDVNGAKEGILTG